MFSIILRTFILTSLCVFIHLNQIFPQETFELLISHTDHQNILDCNQDQYGYYYLIGDQTNTQTFQTCPYILKLNETYSLRDLSNDKRVIKQIWQCNYQEVLNDVDTIEEFNNLNSETR